MPAARGQPTVSSIKAVSHGASQVPAARGQPSMTINADASGHQGGGRPNNIAVKADGIDLQSDEPTARDRPTMTSGTSGKRGGGRPIYFTSRAYAEAHGQDMTEQHDFDKQEHRVVDCLLRVGDQVWKRVTTRYRGEDRLVQWTGRLIIEDVLAGHIFAVRNPKGERQLVHAHRLERYRENEPR